MSNVNSLSRTSSGERLNRERRVLVCVATGRGASFALRLAGAGYEVQRTTAADAARVLDNFTPQVVVIELPEGSRADEQLTLARRLRAGGAQLPLVLVFDGVRDGAREDAHASASDASDGHAARAALEVARELGADDCFALATPTPETLARLDALFWRIETARDLSSLERAHAERERRAEIDGFMQLLDAARARFDAGEPGALALVAAATGGSTNGAQPTDAESILRAAHEFLARNLRRADAIAFYGPDLLLAHLPRLSTEAAGADLARLSEEFSASHDSRRVIFGVARFPIDGADVETLIEKAEAALASARERQTETVVAAHGTPERINSRVARDDGRVRSLVGGGGVESALVAARDDEDDAFGRQAEETTGEAKGVGGAAERGGGGTSRDARSLTSEELNTRVASETTQDASPSAPDAARLSRDQSPSARGLASSPRALRESRRGEALETSVLPASSIPDTVGGGVLARAAAEAATREREMRSRGVLMPRRVLLTISDPARMAQVNLLLRSASYEVRAAFDGRQALDLLRIERADALLLDTDLKEIGGLEVLRRLSQRHQGRLPMPVVLLHAQTAEGARECEEARRLGARGFIALPYDPALLLEAVREAGKKD
jgi:two-component system chemotaxis response regulator CheY